MKSPETLVTLVETFKLKGGTHFDCYVRINVPTKAITFLSLQNTLVLCTKFILHKYK